MKKYLIETEVDLGMSHCGSVCLEGKAYVELSDDEVSRLIQLMRETGSTDVYDMELETVYPELFEKLNDACYEAAWTPTTLHWLNEGLEMAIGDPEFDEENVGLRALMKKAWSEFGFRFRYKAKDYTDSDGRINRNRIESDRLCAFKKFIDKLLEEMDDNEKIDFYLDNFKTSLEGTEIESYDLIIPQEIIDRAFPDEPV